ncbi:MAG: polysaccharide biosynthesis C-terminal domain-containing protein [Deltaproteobacteria bacterium]|nr:polysaccharide biosynthesis C-terminal domain-containing protein [Deltaproteobacteria bacterium]
MNAAEPAPQTAPASGPVRSEERSTLARTRQLVIARGASTVLTFCIPLVLARMLNTTQYGTYKQFVLVAQTAYLLLPFGVTQSLYYFLPNGQNRRAYICQTHLFTGAVAAAAAVVLFVFGAPIATRLGNPGLGAFRGQLGLYAAGLLASLPFEITFTARGRTGQAAVTYILSDIARTAAMTLPVLLGWGMAGLTTGLAAWATARWVAALLLTVRGETGPAFTRATWSQQWRYALPFGTAMLVAVPQNYFHQYAVSASVTAAEFAAYSIGCFQLPLVDLLYMPTTEILMVRIGELDAEKRSAEAAGVFSQAVARLSQLFLPLALFLFAAAGDFVPALFSTRYLSAVPIFRVAVWAIVLSSFPADGALRARKRTDFILRSYVLKAVVAVPAVIVGIHAWGAFGAIIGWLLGEVAGKGILLARLPETLAASVRELLPLRTFAKTLAAGTAAAAAVALFAWAAPPEKHVARLAFECLLFAGVHAGVLALLGERPLALVTSFIRG